MGTDGGRHAFGAPIGAVITAIALAVAVAISSPGFSKSRALARKEACIANMRTIGGAAGICALETRVPARWSPGLTDLRRDGYLKREPECPSHGVYRIEVRSAEGAGRVRVDVRCDVHRGVDDTTSGL